MKVAGALLALSAGLALAGDVEFAEGDTFLAPAPKGVTSDYLGMGLSATLETEARDGSELSRAFPKKVDSKDEARSGFEFTAIENARDFAVYTELTGASSPKASRLLVIHAYTLARVESLKIAPGAGAMGEAELTPVEVWYGWRVSIVVEGDRSTFTKALRAQFKKGCDVEALAKANGLSTRVVLSGLSEPSGLAPSLVLSTAEELLKGFAADSEPVPVFVRYRHAQRAAVEEIRWLAKKAAPLSGPPVGEFRLTVVELKVAPKNQANKDWDAFGGLPDPVVAVGVVQLNAEGKPVAGTRMFSDPELNTLTPKVPLRPNTFRMTAGPKYTLALEVRDNDQRKHEEIGKLAGKVNLHALRQFPAELDLTSKCQGKIESLKIRIEQLE